MANGRCGTGALPAYPVYLAIRRIINRRDRILNWPFPSGNNRAYQTGRFVCEEAGVSDRQLRRWRMGENPYVCLETLDKVLCGLDLLWWDVFDETTVRRPVLVVHTRRPHYRTLEGARRRVVDKGQIPYGDLGPDWVTLTRIRMILEPHDVDVDQMELAA